MGKKLYKISLSIYLEYYKFTLLCYFKTNPAEKTKPAVQHQNINYLDKPTKGFLKQESGHYDCFLSVYMQNTLKMLNCFYI